MSSQPGELRDLLALHLTPGLGPQRIAALLEHFGSAARARSARADELRGVPGIGDGLAAGLARDLAGADPDAELARAEKAGVRVIAMGGPDYPRLLADAPAAPRLLYVRGTLTAGDGRAVALVGSRRCTAYGRRMTARLAMELAL